MDGTTGSLLLACYIPHMSETSGVSVRRDEQLDAKRIYNEILDEHERKKATQRDSGSEKDRLRLREE
jgi:hypothetical protein